MRIEISKDKWIVLDDNNKILLMTHHKGIAFHFLKKHLNSGEE
jgi:hypothetical protein